MTTEDILNGNWENPTLYKEINYAAKGKELNAGGLHPLMKMRSEFRQILLEMGF